MNEIGQDPETTGIKTILSCDVTPIKKKESFNMKEKIDLTISKISKTDHSIRSTKLLEHAEVIELKNKTEKKNSEPVKKHSLLNKEKSESVKKHSLLNKEKSESVKKHSLLNKEKSESVKKHSLLNNDKSESVKIKETPSSKEPAKKDPKAPKDSAVRSSVRKSLLDALVIRREEAKSEFKGLTLARLKNLCKEIENQLYLAFDSKDILKYKSHYRSLLFNIRDKRNEGFFRNILKGSIPPEKIASLTSEEMASKELIEWRAQEKKKDLEAIQKHELERNAHGDLYVMKSHKGEIMIDKDELDRSSIDADSVINLALGPPKSPPHKDMQEEEAGANHKNPSYDHNCHSANSELHEFALSRDKEVELEAIQKSELERQDLCNPHMIQYHKEEIKIDNNKLGKKNNYRPTGSVINLAPGPSKSLPPKDLQEDEAGANHKNPIYDQNCHISANSELHEFALSRSKVEDTSVKCKSRYPSLLFSIQDKRNEGLFRNIPKGSISPEKVSCLTSVEMASKELIESREQEKTKDTSVKCKSRYPSLLFSIQDKRNEGLFRNIPKGSISPEKVSCLTSVEMASKELIESREQEKTKELEAIQKRERIALHNPYMMKYHKGEIIIDIDEVDKKNNDTDSVITLSPDQAKSLPQKDLLENEALTNHKNHIYDHNCHSANSELHEFALSRVKEVTNNDGERSPYKHSRLKNKHCDNERDSYEERSSKEDSKAKVRKRRHSETILEDIKRDGESLIKRSLEECQKRHHRESEKQQSPRRKESECGRGRSPKARDSLERYLHQSESKVCTSDDVIFVSQNSSDVIDVESTSTLVGAPVHDYGSDMDMLSTAESIPYSKELENENSISNQSETLVPSSDSFDVSPSTTPPLSNDNDSDNEIEGIFSTATPPLPDDVDEDRITPQISKVLHKIQRKPQIPIWRGVINMADVARFAVLCFEISGKPMLVIDEIQPFVDVVAHYRPDNVWSYIDQEKKSGSKEILVVRFQPINEDEKLQYIKLFTYLSSEQRYGVVNVKPGIAIKSFFIFPLASDTPIPQVLLSLDNPEYEESRPHMLIGVIVQTRHKKIYDPLTGNRIINEAPRPLAYSFANIEDKGSVTEVDAGIDELPSFENKEKPNDSTVMEIQQSEGRSPPAEEVTILAEVTIVEEEAEEDVLDEAKLLTVLNRMIEKDQKELTEIRRKMKKLENNKASR